MKKWLREKLLGFLHGEERNEVVQTRPRYQQFQCDHEFKVIKADNGGHIIVMAERENEMEIRKGYEQKGKVYIVAEGESLGDVVTSILVEKKLNS